TVTYVYKENKKEDHQEDYNNHDDQNNGGDKNQGNSPDYHWDFGGHDQGDSNASDTYGNQFPRTGEKTTFSLIAKI
ncbi:hypothetical protein, partial [Enterococcus faecalis]|uniref:hypothetical protein n=1 Tax=Enterococcus faecalis TaxID=1351 RepID=UPI003D1040A4